MNVRKQYQAYQNNAVHTASGGQLTLMLYNGCIKFINQAMKHVENKDYEAKNTNIQKAQNIIQELMLTLDPNIPLSQELMPLYDYVNHQLQKGNINNDINALQDALSFTTEFRNTWKEVLKTTSEKYAQGTRV